LPTSVITFIFFCKGKAEISVELIELKALTTRNKMADFQIADFEAAIRSILEVVAISFKQFILNTSGG
jgi:hypothetical protein